MVDEPSQVARLGGVDDRHRVDSEEVAAADAHALIVLLALVGHALSDGLAHVLDHHLIGGDRLHGIQTPAVDGALAELEILLTELLTQNKKRSLFTIPHTLFLNISRYFYECSKIISPTEQKKKRKKKTHQKP